MYVLIYDYLKFRKDPSITSQEKANYISAALAVALSVHAFRKEKKLKNHIFIIFFISLEPNHLLTSKN